MTSYNKVNGDWGGENSVLINEILKGDWKFPGWVMSDWGAVHSTEKAALAGLDQESGIELDERLNGAVFFTDRLRSAIVEGRVSMARLDDMARRIVGAMIAVGAFDEPPPGVELKTVIVAVLAVVTSVAGIWARSSVGLTKVVGRGLPFQRTIEPA